MPASCCPEMPTRGPTHSTCSTEGGGTDDAPAAVERRRSRPNARVPGWQRPTELRSSSPDEPDEADGRVVSALRAGHGANGHGDDPDRRRTRRARSHCPRRHVAAVVPPPPDRARLEWSMGAPRGHPVGVDHARPSVPRRRQVQSRPPGGRIRRLLAPRRRAVPPRRWLGPAGRCRDRDVTAADARSHRMVRQPAPTGADDLQHPRRVSRCRGRDRRDHEPSIIAAASWLERVSYRAADAVTVLSDDLRDNVVAKLPEGAAIGST